MPRLLDVTAQFLMALYLASIASISSDLGASLMTGVGCGIGFCSGVGESTSGLRCPEKT